MRANAREPWQIEDSILLMLHLVFAGVTLEIEDTRKDYGEKRIICFGRLAGRMVVVGYTPRDAGTRQVFSMRKANEREQARVAPLLEV